MNTNNGFLNNTTPATEEEVNTSDTLNNGQDISFDTKEIPQDLPETSLAYRFAYEECKARRDELEEKCDKLLQSNKIKNIIIIILIIIILLLLKGCGDCNCGNCPENEVIVSTIPSISDGDPLIPLIPDEPAPTPDLNDRDYVTMPMLTDIVLSKENPVLTFYNPIENQNLFDICYTITDKDGNEIYSSGMRLAGESWNVDMSQYFPTGTTDVRISISSQFTGTHKAANGCGSNISISIL